MPPLSEHVLAHGTGTDALGEAVLVFFMAVWALGMVRVVRMRPGVRRVVGLPRMFIGLAGIGVLAVAVSPPLDSAADVAFSVHMVQHLLIGLIAPIMVCVARPVLVLSSILDPPVRRRFERAVSRRRRTWGFDDHLARWAILLTALHVGVWWTWHVPVLFNFAVHHELVHASEHACLFTVGVVLWGTCLRVRWEDRGLLALFVLFGAAVGTGMIGALITIAPRPVYATTVAGVHRWGLTRLSDQQLGGVIMWVAGGAVYLVGAFVIALRLMMVGPKPGEVTFNVARLAPTPPRQPSAN